MRGKYRVSGNTVPSDAFIKMRGRLSSLSVTCQRFTSILRHCDVETFLNSSRIYPEVAPMEKRIDMHIELLCRDEFRAYECVSDAAKYVVFCHFFSAVLSFLYRMQSQFDHLAETCFNGFDLDLGERELGYALSIDHDLEMFAASIGLIKTAVSAIMEDQGEYVRSAVVPLIYMDLPDIETDAGGLEPQADFFEPLQRLLDQGRSVRVLTKFVIPRSSTTMTNEAIQKIDQASGRPRPRILGSQSPAHPSASKFGQ